jgi:hypothetical protein
MLIFTLIYNVASPVFQSALQRSSNASKIIYLTYCQLNTI